MGKASKKKPAKNADFAKTKTKVGRKLQPQNATDTSYAAKTVGLPTQSITVDKSAKLVTKRNHTLEDLLVMLGHTNKTSRKEALAEMEELFLAFPQLLSSTASSVVQASVQRIADDEGVVRKALLAFYGFYLKRVPHTLLEPFQNTLMLHLHSALSSIFEPIRFDALKFLDLFLDAFPAVVSSGTFDQSGQDSYGHRTLLCLAPLLQVEIVGHATSASMTPANQLPLPQRAQLLSTFDKFIRASLSEYEEAQEDWFYAASFERSRDAHQFLQQCKGHAAPWMVADEDEAADVPCLSTLANSKNLFQDTSASLASLGGVVDELLQQQSNGLIKSTVTPLLLYHRMSQQLLNSFLEVSQNCFLASATPSQTFDASLDIVRRSLSIQCHLFRAALAEMKSKPLIAEESAQKLQKFLERSAMYFPFERQGQLQSKPQSLVKSLQTCSALFSELVPLLSLATTSLTTKTFSKTLTRLQASADALMRPVATYLHSVLSVEDDFGSTLEAAALENLLPTIWLILDGRSLQDADRESILASLYEIAASPKGQNVHTRARLFEFLSRVWLTRDAQGYKGSIGQSDAGTKSMQAKVNKWGEGLSRLLWEAGKEKHPVAKRILLFLYHMQTRGGLPFDTTQLFFLGFGSYFAMIKTKPTRKVILGPYVHMDPATRALARHTALLFTDGAETPAASTIREALDAAERSLVTAEK